MEEKKHILIISQDIPLVDFLTVGLAQEAYDIEHAPDDVQGISCARNHSPDVILLDIPFPYVGEFKILKKLRAEISTQKTSIAVLIAGTIHAHPALKIADAFLQKDEVPELFLKSVKAFLRQPH